MELSFLVLVALCWSLSGWLYLVSRTRIRTKIYGIASKGVRAVEPLIRALEISRKIGDKSGDNNPYIRN